MRADFFYTPERNTKSLAGRTWDEYWAENQGVVKEVVLEDLDPDLDLAGLLKAYLDAGYPKGSQRGGVFQVQTDKGIYKHRKGHRNLLKSSPGWETFSTWEELEEQD